MKDEFKGRSMIYVVEDSRGNYVPGIIPFSEGGPKFLGGSRLQDHYRVVATFPDVDIAAFHAVSSACDHFNEGNEVDLATLLD